MTRVDQWMAAFQEQLDNESSTATMDAPCHEHQSSPDDSFIAQSPLTFGAYNISPLVGLHFDTAEDTAAS